MSSKFLKCSECDYERNCPTYWSYLNAACITFQRPKSEMTRFLDKFQGLLDKSEVDDQLDRDYSAHTDIWG